MGVHGAGLDAADVLEGQRADLGGVAGLQCGDLEDGGLGGATEGDTECLVHSQGSGTIQDHGVGQDDLDGLRSRCRLDLRGLSNRSGRFRGVGHRGFDSRSLGDRSHLLNRSCGLRGGCCCHGFRGGAGCRSGSCGARLVLQSGGFSHVSNASERGCVAN